MRADFLINCRSCCHKCKLQVQFVYFR